MKRFTLNSSNIITKNKLIEKQEKQKKKLDKLEAELQNKETLLNNNKTKLVSLQEDTYKIKIALDKANTEIIQFRPQCQY